MKRIKIFDTTLRDGEQSPGCSMNLKEKIEMAQQLEKLGVDIIEAGFAIASPMDHKSVKAIAGAVENCTVASLARCVRGDIDAAWDAVKDARHPRIHVFLATSDIHMEYKPESVSKTMRIVFPIAVTIIVGLVAPQSVALVGFLMFGNLIRECGVLGTMSETAQNQLANLVTLLLGITISFSMRAEHFVRIETLMIMVIGLFAFVMDTIGGVCLAKFMNLFLKKKINPMIGGAGISAFPMSSRVVQKLALEEDPSNILIMHAAGANVSGQIASVVAGGLVINLVSQFL